MGGGTERLLSKWRRYARTVHGDNVILRDLFAGDPSRAKSFHLGIRRVFRLDAPTADADAAESHFKDALMSRAFGLNRR